jgi:class 3 adenylate cyclase
MLTKRPRVGPSRDRSWPSDETAARIEELTKLHGAVIFVPEEKRRRVGDAVAFSPAGSAVVQGKSEPVAIYVPLVPEDTEVRSARRVPWTS